MTCCPCRVGTTTLLPYADCCGLYHQGYAKGLRAPSAQAVMRSRYSAYALAVTNNVQGRAMLTYLHATWHAMTDPDDLEISPTQWTGLQVQHCEESGDVAVVEFTAHYKVNGVASEMHETSRFVRQGDKGWLYIDGEVSAGG